MPNGSLHDFIHSKKIKIDIDRILDIIIDVAQAMVYLHKKGYLHCDLKSSNILVDKSWNIKLADFGLSRIRDSSSRFG
jgi:serine/threonine protein kinase